MYRIVEGGIVVAGDVVRGIDCGSFGGGVGVGCQERGWRAVGSTTDILDGGEDGRGVTACWDRMRCGF